MRDTVLSLFVFALMATTNAFAAVSGGNSVALDLTVNRGGFAFGAEYENQTAQPFGMGGFFLLSPKDKDKGEPSYFMLGGFIRPHFAKDRWDLYINPGVALNFVGEVGNKDNETVFGTVFTVGVLYQLNAQASLGLEDMHFQPWTGDDWRGVNFHTTLLKFRYAF